MPPEDSRPTAFPWSFVILTYALSWSTWLLGWYALGQPDEMSGSSAIVPVIFAGSFGPGLAAAILTARQGWGPLKQWLGSFVRFRCGYRAYVAAFLPFPLAVVLLTVLFGYEPIIDQGGGHPAAAFYLTIFPMAIVNGLATVLMGAGPLGEEGGWRGYMLPRLLEKFGEIPASLIVGVVWALWHLPVMAMFPDWRGGMDFWTYLPLYVGSVIALSFLMTRIWAIGRGSLVPVIWLHGIINAIGSMAFEKNVWASGWSEEFGIVLFMAAAMIAWLVLTRTKPELIASRYPRE
ncbi:CPBP family intramembrane metalloprotease [Qipengyuania sp. SS22]|uniref:CPBP family intramembrane glutamic endopeptidase n=1 Tax=Qipengyuania sp. SS22 TaxID=2979461 RepID=UPI0021E565DD|nr:type II CAAX endopeptidase family protein [Qipengyuania sp. SS22]UYH55437.1 CPBP family intramembrane metalloprotease [Qipengyuania sp. SS22]